MINSPVNPSVGLTSPLTGLANVGVNSLSIAPEDGGDLQDAHQVFVDEREIATVKTVSQQLGNSTFQLLSFGQMLPRTPRSRGSRASSSTSGRILQRGHVSRPPRSSTPW